MAVIAGQADRPQRVAIKFCGGCDPAFDRGEYWQQVQEAAGDKITWVSLEDGDYEAALVICGCPKTCPVEELPPIRYRLIVSDDHLPPGRVVSKLLTRGRS